MSKKRAHGEGSIKQLKNGKWHGQLMDGYKKDGKRKIVSFTGITKSEVLQLIREYKEKKAQNPNMSEIPTFSEWADHWYTDHRTQVAESTYSGYKYTLKLLKGSFGDCLISSILPMDVNDYFNRLLEEGWSLSKINKCRTMLIQIFDSAEQNDLINRNPARNAKIIRRDLINKARDKNKKDAFTEEEIACLLSELPNDLLGNSIRLLLVSGLRLQELLALTPQDIEADGSAININKAVQMVDGVPKLGPPKNQTSRRIIPIPELYRHLPIYLREHGGRLFIWQSHRIGEPCKIEHFRKKYFRALKALPVRRLTPHCCRHTYITWLQRKGVPMETIARLAGHSNIGTTNGYLHAAQDTLAKAVEVLTHHNKMDKNGIS